LLTLYGSGNHGRYLLFRKTLAVVLEKQF